MAKRFSSMTSAPQGPYVYDSILPQVLYGVPTGIMFGSTSRPKLLFIVMEERRKLQKGGASDTLGICAWAERQEDWVARFVRVA